MPPAQPTSLLRDKPLEVQLGVLEERGNNVGAGVERNHKTTTSGIKDLGDKLEKLGTDLVTKFDAKVEKLAATYATKDEVAEVKAKVKSIQANLSWGAKSVIGAVILAIMGMVLAKGGVPHP